MAARRALDVSNIAGNDHDIKPHSELSEGEEILWSSTSGGHVISHGTMPAMERSFWICANLSVIITFWVLKNILIVGGGTQLFMWSVMLICSIAAVRFAMGFFLPTRGAKRAGTMQYFITNRRIIEERLDGSMCHSFGKCSFNSISVVKEKDQPSIYLYGYFALVYDGEDDPSSYLALSNITNAEQAEKLLIENFMVTNGKIETAPPIKQQGSIL